MYNIVDKENKKSSLIVRLDEKRKNQSIKGGIPMKGDTYGKYR